MKKNIFKLLSLVLLLSVATVACNDKKACAEDCKKECCEKKDDAAASNEEATSTDETTEVDGEEQAHVCTAACEADPHSCPNHDHDHDH